MTDFIESAKTSDWTITGTTPVDPAVGPTPYNTQVAPLDAVLYGNTISSPGSLMSESVGANQQVMLGRIGRQRFVLGQGGYYPPEVSS